MKTRKNQVKQVFPNLRVQVRESGSMTSQLSAGQFLKYVNDIVEAPVGVEQHLLGCGLPFVASLKGTL